MNASANPDEFFYRWPQRFAGHRPGAHHGIALGSGQQAVAHRRLFDHPDPRRLDLRASLRAPHGDWLVRVARPHVASALVAIVDVSPSMHFGARRHKIEVAAQFVRAMGWSAFRNGDAAGLMAFDHEEREELHCPPRHGRGVSWALAQALAGARARHAPGHASGRSPARGLIDCARRLAGRQALVFIVSDFHGLDAAELTAVLDTLDAAVVVPMLAWDSAETQPPERDGLLLLADSESPRRAQAWITAKLRASWRAAVAARRAELDGALAERACPVFELCAAPGGFDAQALTRYFYEGQA